MSDEGILHKHVFPQSAYLHHKLYQAHTETAGGPKLVQFHPQFQFSVSFDVKCFKPH